MVQAVVRAGAVGGVGDGASDSVGFSCSAGGGGVWVNVPEAALQVAGHLAVYLVMHLVAKATVQADVWVALESLRLLQSSELIEQWANMCCPIS